MDNSILIEKLGKLENSEKTEKTGKTGKTGNNPNSFTSNEISPVTAAPLALPPKFLSKITFTPYTFQRCPSCKFHLGAIFKAIDLCKIGAMYSLVCSESTNDSIIHVLTSKINKMLIAETKPIGDILDAFHIKKNCCRMHITGQMDLERTF